MAIIKKTDILEDGKIFENLQKEIDTLKASLKDLIAVSKDLKKTNSGAEAKQRVKVTEDLTKTTEKLTALEKERLRVEQQIIATSTKQFAASDKNNLTLEKYKLTLAETNKLTKQQAKESLGLVNAYDKLSKKTLEAQKNYKKLAAEFGTNSKQAKSALQDFQKLDNQLSSINKGARDGKKDVGRYGLALKNLGSQFLGAVGITTGFNLAFSAAAKFSDQLRALNTLTKKVTSTFNENGKSSKKLAADILAIADTFDKDYNEILISANTVSKEMGISAAKSLELIQEGFLKGSDNSGQFMDILKEYPAQFKAAGIDAETMFAIINQQVKQGIYSDKGVDAIKEGGLRLRENTKAVQDALKPLSESVKMQIKQEIAAGNSFKAIQLVSKELSNTSLTAQQTQTIIADVFGGAGEDAGIRYLQTLSDINVNLKDVGDQATESQKATLDLNKNWNYFVSGVSEGTGIFAKTWTFFKKALASAIGLFAELLSFEAAYGKALKLTNVDLQVKNKRVSSLTKETKELTKAEKDLLDEQLRANAELEAQIRTTNISLLEDIRQKALEELAYWNEKEQAKINTSKASAQVRNLALEALERLHQQKLKEIEAEFYRPPASTINEIDNKVSNTQVFATEIDKFGNANKVDEAVKLTEEINQNIADVNDAFRKEELEKEKAQAEAITTIKNEAVEVAKNFVIDSLQTQVDDELAEKTAQIEAEKDLLKDKLDKGRISETAYKNELEKLNRKQREEEAKAEKKKALYDIAINTAVAVVKSLPNLLLAGTVFALGGLQALAVAAKPVPKFEKGQINISGKRHSQGGVMAEIEGGESVITRTGTANAPKILEMVNSGMIKDDDLIKEKKVSNNDFLSSKLDRLNNSNDKILTALINSGVAQYTNAGKTYIRFADGSVIESIEKK